MSDVRDLLSIKIESPYWEDSYNAALSDPLLPDWLSDDFILRLRDEYAVLPKMHEIILKAVPCVRAVPELVLLAKTLYHILATRKSFSKAFSAFEAPKAKAGDENALGYDLVAIFPVLAHLELTWHELAARGIEKDVLTHSLRWVDSLYQAIADDTGTLVYGEKCFSLYSVGIYVKSLTIGRLRFEISEGAERPVRIFQNQKGEYLPLMDNARIHPTGHLVGSYGCDECEDAYDADFKEGEEAYEGYTVDPTTRLVKRVRVRLPKNEWTQVYASGDTVLKVHIPEGGKLDPDICRESYRRARELYARSYPEYDFKCYIIGCWMLSPVLKEILSPDSNILSFSAPFTVFPIKNTALDAFLYVFGIKKSSVSEIDFAELTENNSLQRGIKKKSLAGDFVHQFGGYMPI